MSIVCYFKVIRPQQWYKNLLVFLPLIFVGQLFDQQKFLLTLVGFVALCLVSSANYLINDIVDLKKDRAHPEKRRRPIASGRIPVLVAVVYALVLFGIGAWIAYRLDVWFLYFVLFLFGLTQLYSFWLKKEAFADILVIATNFVTRAVSGTFLIDVNISPWLVLCTFFFALFLSAGKRYADLAFLGAKAFEHKESLKVYTKEVANALMLIATMLLIAMYSAYALLGEHRWLGLSLPFALYAIFRYFSLVYTGSPIARHPHLVVMDKRMVVAMLLWVISVFAAIYRVSA
jgi:4-hydroxybenzoate polyprenyltransferase